MNRQFTTITILVLFLAMTLSGVAMQNLSAQTFAPDVEMISFDENGAMTPLSQTRFSQLLAGPVPTDVFILSHGWLNNFSDARSSYREMMQIMQAVAVRHHLLNSSYRSLVIGISWPSKSFDDETQGAGRSATVEDSDLLAIYRAFPRPNTGGEDYSADVQTMEELLALSPENVSRDHYDTLSKLFTKYRIRQPDSFPSAMSDDEAFFQLGQSGRGLFDSRLSIRQGLRMFTYWQMKERAGIVGASGVRPMLASLQATFISSKFHLLGHSFGAKLMLSCLGTGAPPSRKVDSLILLQGAVSYQAMSPIGGYAHVPSRVAGPVVATYSDNDSALGTPYELASRAAGQTAEQRSISRFSALGRVGPELGAARTIVSSVSDDKYQFTSDVYRVYGDAFITGHSDFKNEAVARMLWAAVQPTSVSDAVPIRSLGRAVGSDEVALVAAQASMLVKQAPSELREEDLLRIYTDTIETLLNAGKPRQTPSGFPLNFASRPGFEFMTADDANRINTRHILADRLVDPQFLEIPSYRQSIRSWLIDERSRSAAGRILAGSCEQARDTDFKQCVAICYKNRFPTASSYRLLGSGTLIDWDIVVTAGHVVPPPLSKVSLEERERILKDYQFGVCFGAEGPNVNGVLPAGSIIIPVKVRVEHPSFSGAPLANDLAVLQLERDATSIEVFGQDNQELEFRLAKTDIWADGQLKVVTLAGFGFCDRNAEQGAGIRRAAKDVLAAVPETESEAGAIGVHFGTEFAAGGQGIDTCNGDSGGPVFARTQDGTAWCVGATSRPTTRRIVGGVRVSGDDGSPDTCGDGGVYTLLYKYPWIQQTIETLHAGQ